MEQAEFTGQIEKHEARIKKYSAISGAVGCVKLLFALLLGFFIVLSFYFMFSGNLRAEMIVWCLITGASLVAVWIYHDKVRDKIKHSGDMITINKKHMDRIADIETANDSLQPFFTSDDFTTQQTAVINLNRDTGFSNYYEDTIKKDSSGGVTRKPAADPADEEVFAKAATIKFLMM